MGKVTLPPRNPDLTPGPVRPPGVAERIWNHVQGLFGDHGPAREKAKRTKVKRRYLK